MQACITIVILSDLQSASRRRLKSSLNSCCTKLKNKGNWCPGEDSNLSVNA